MTNNIHWDFFIEKKKIGWKINGNNLKMVATVQEKLNKN